jgi:hypothetical protein
MDDVCERDHVEAAVGDRLKSIDLMTVKDVIKIIQIENIAREHAGIETMERRYATSDFQHRQPFDTSEIAKLLPVELSIPK